MITYFFPPLVGVGVQRALRYARHLPAFGWQPVVLTVTRGLQGETIDTDSVDKIPGGLPVIRTGLLDMRLPARWLHKLGESSSYGQTRLGDQPRGAFRRFLDYGVCRPCRVAAARWDRFADLAPPDHYLGWLPFAYLAARRILHRETIDVVYTVSAPYTTHVVGYLLKRSTGKPWIADFRDEWTQNPTRSPMFNWQGRADRRLEQRALRHADIVVTATESYKALMSSLVAPQLRKKFMAITNSFDADDFNISAQPPDQNRFHVVYCGSFYAMQQPAHFLAAVRRLVESGDVPLGRLSLRFVGYTRYSTREMFKDGVLQSVITSTGVVSHREAIRQMQQADVLLLIVSNLRGRENVPAKTFEYIATGKCILALVPPDGEAARIIQESGTGIVVPPEDTEAIKDAFLELYQRWTTGGLRIHPNWEYIGKYEAQEVTRRLSSALDSLVSD